MLVHTRHKTTPSTTRIHTAQKKNNAKKATTRAEHKRMTLGGAGEEVTVCGTKQQHHINMVTTSRNSRQAGCGLTSHLDTAMPPLLVVAFALASYKSRLTVCFRFFFSVRERSLCVRNLPNFKWYCSHEGKKLFQPMSCKNGLVR